MTDCWADWIRSRRTGGDAEFEAKMLEQLTAVRDKVLDRTDLRPGETLLDVGCGNGLIGFGALERGAAEVVFSDVSGPLLDDCREMAAKAGVIERCRFIEVPAENLGTIDADSIDVVTTRSVLIYVKKRIGRSPSSTGCCAPAAGSRSSSQSTVSGRRSVVVRGATRSTTKRPA